MTGNRVAYRYANALFVLSLEKKKTEEIFNDLQAIGHNLKMNSQILSVLENPVLDSGKKQSVVLRLFANRIDGMTTAFLEFLGNKSRLNILGQICDEFASIYRKSMGSIDAEVFSAVDISSEQEKEIEKFLSKQTGKKVSLKKSVDKKFIGGFAIRVEDTFYDNTLRSKLNGLAKKLISD